MMMMNNVLLQTRRKCEMQRKGVKPPVESVCPTTKKHRCWDREREYPPEETLSFPRRQTEPVLERFTLRANALVFLGRKP